MDNIKFIVFYFSLSLIFLIGTAFFLFKRKKKQKIIFSSNWKKLEQAISSSNGEEITTYGKTLLWNDNMERISYDKLKKAIESENILETTGIIELKKELHNLYDKNGWLI